MTDTLLIEQDKIIQSVKRELDDAGFKHATVYEAVVDALHTLHNAERMMLALQNEFNEFYRAYQQAERVSMEQLKILWAAHIATVYAVFCQDDEIIESWADGNGKYKLNVDEVKTL